jgi:hypothetical protein
MDTAFVISWKVPFPGREKQALELAAQAEEYWGKQASEGRCTAPEWFFMPSGWAMWMVKGEHQVLEELIRSDEARRLLARGTLLLEDWQYALAETGSGAERFMADYGRIGGELGFI